MLVMYLAGQRQHRDRREGSKVFCLHDQGGSRLAVVTGESNGNQLAARHVQSSESSAKLSSSSRMTAASSLEGLPARAAMEADCRSASAAKSRCFLRST